MIALGTPLGNLLFGEVCLLAGMAGIAAWQWLWPGLLALACLALLDGFGRSGFARPWAHPAALALCFLCGLGYTALRVPSPPPVPAWLERAAAASVDPHQWGGRPPPLPVLARVESAEPLPGGRLRVILADIRPNPTGGDDAAAIEEQEQGGAAEDLYRGKILWTWPRYDGARDSLLPGQTVAVALRFAPTRGFENPGQWNSGRYWRARGVFFRAWTSREATPRSWFAEPGLFAWAATYRQKLQRAFAGLLPSDSAAGAILPALVFGDRSGLDQASMDRFARATLSHSLALSGMHLSFMVLAGFGLAWGLGRLRPSLLLRLSRPRLALLLALPLAGMYLWLGQAPPSLQRAAWMLAFWTLLVFLHRPRVLLDGLFAALTCILLLNPLALFDLGLQLSALAVATIDFCLPVAQAVAGRCFPRSRLLRGLVGIAMLSLCIQIALLPITVNAFGLSGLLFPLNMIWLPALQLLVLPFAFLGLLALWLGFPAIAVALLQPAIWPCEALTALLTVLDGADCLPAPLLPRPHWLVWAGFWLLCLSLPWLVRAGKKALARAALPRWAMLTAGLALLVLPPLWQQRQEAGERLVALRLLDVGQGQSLLVEWRGLGPERAGGRALIDGGGFASGSFDLGKGVLAPILTDKALPHLNLVINSHPDADHLAGLLYILDSFRVGGYYGNGNVPAPALGSQQEAILRRRGARRETLAAGDALPLGPGLVLETLWPPSNTPGSGPAGSGAMELASGGRNESSLVLRLVWQGRTLALICGDVGKGTLRELAREHGEGLRAEALVLPHHGSATSLQPSFYDAVRPRLALAATGHANRWGFPSPPVREALRERGIPLLHTGADGQIHVRWREGEDFAVTTAVE